MAVAIEPTRHETERRPRVSCDSLVALGSATADGATLFAKNSDRPAQEAQPLVWAPRRRHPRGDKLRCQYIEIDQAAETAALIGSRPYWLWGFEHGVNEHGVAIGNHTVFTKDALCGAGLIGMDLVRLGLERATSAFAAVETITALVEEHGQGGSGYADKDWPYHNSFLVADREDAFLLETSDRRWAVRAIRDTGSASNHLTIGSDWDSLAFGTIEHAVDNGWWSPERQGRFDFAAAYRDTGMAPEVISSGRHRRTCELLAAAKGKLTAADLRRALRDHYDSGTTFRPAYAPDDERYFSVCMHADPVGTTTAAMIARLPPAAGDIVTCWACLGSPCAGVFIPFYVEAGVPEALARAGERPSADSPWWRFKKLLELVESDWEGRAPAVRAAWDDLEARIDAETAQMEAHARDLLARGSGEAARAALAELSRRTVELAMSRLEELIGRFRG